MEKRIMQRKGPAIALAAIFAVAFSSAVDAKIKCWKNSEGVRECGNAVPPEYAQEGHETLNKRGLTVDSKKAAKTVEELEAERAAQEKQRQLALEEKKREQRDRVLLDTFASEDDLVLTRDGQIAHLDSQIRLTQSHIDKLQNNLDQMIERAAEVERRGETPSEEMIKNIDNVRGQIEENETFIATKAREQTEIRSRFDADIERFRELKQQSRR